MHAGLAVFTQQALSGEGAAAGALGSLGASCLLGRLSAQLLPEHLTWRPWLVKIHVVFRKLIYLSGRSVAICGPSLQLLLQRTLKSGLRSGFKPAAPPPLPPWSTPSLPGAPLAWVTPNSPAPGCSEGLVRPHFPTLVFFLNSFVETYNSDACTIH